MDGSKTDGKHEGLDENGFDMGWDDPLIPRQGDLWVHKQVSVMSWSQLA